MSVCMCVNQCDKSDVVVETCSAARRSGHSPDISLRIVIEDEGDDKTK